eukprot:CAMPEP_0173424944 /NCGR_PEP_ID=MMETSP1357-20121228/4756_1 /TAXON_ID=77926 /ORGANISM="Hemiselmis rufescens, Strain PCC563" /LENGTH=130 /DNA_ID=CAMNT_0014388283 /DNA_START=160 /DNA_END=552 /DNA_ORIENTATION=-
MQAAPPALALHPGCSTTCFVVFREATKGVAAATAIGARNLRLLTTLQVGTIILVPHITQTPCTLNRRVLLLKKLHERLLIPALCTTLVAKQQGLLARGTPNNCHGVCIPNPLPPHPEEAVGADEAGANLA